MHELKKILLATDLDGNSDAIVSTAAMLSQAFDSRILLLHVMPDVLPDTLTDEDGPDPVAALLDELKVRIEADASVAPAHRSCDSSPRQGRIIASPNAERRLILVCH